MSFLFTTEISFPFTVIAAEQSCQYSRPNTFNFMNLCQIIILKYIKKQ